MGKKDNVTGSKDGGKGWTIKNGGGKSSGGMIAPGLGYPSIYGPNDKIPGQKPMPEKKVNDIVKSQLEFLQGRKDAR